MTPPFTPVDADTSTEATILEIVGYEEFIDLFHCKLTTGGVTQDQVLAGILVLALTGGGGPEDLVGAKFAFEYDNVV